MDVEEIVLITLIIGASAALLLNRKRRWWVRPWIEQRETNSQGNSNLLHNELAVLDKENYKNFIRMDEDTFNDLLKLIENDIQKQDTKFRNAISAKDRLSVTLRYLATGESYKSLSFSFRMGQSTIAGIIPEVCIAIYNNLKNQYLKPFPFRNMTWQQRIFNYRLSRARRVVENAFGILTNRFRVLLNIISLDPSKAQTLTLACIVLHNFLRTRSPNGYDVKEQNIDRRFTFKYTLSRQAGNRSTASALDNRNEFVQYVNGIGAVEWQNDLA
ncbi:hypothetical protein PPYR_15278 [Photinus pyralis]|uniref:DDE Tnp4 domain-containing protein n=1 Tax=Photinus pyralis TaxID=7054 RepID=A0A5N3ZZ60_PHOPY|nr:hypothetical protein PPYR_15748 [Photinus pyralis]KAB0790355.1 hypothetical protein PPYR_15278 [Photinus pyralis]